MTGAARARAAADGIGSDSVAIFPEWERFDTAELVGSARRWLAERHHAGFGGITIPVESGGLGLTAAHDVAYEAAEAEFDTPPSEIWNLGMHMVIPAIDMWGTDAQRSHFVVPGIKGELLFCQLFSEPGAGSDLASVATRAVSSDDGWVVNGQKVWTSAAHVADFGMLLCRTGTAEQRHSGLTCLLVPLDAPGVTIRPIKQITGGSAFNEVFFDHVVVPDELRLGEVGGGWAVVTATLGTERLSVPINGPHGSPSRLITLAREYGCAHNPVIRQALVDVVIRRKITDLNLERANHLLRDGSDVGPFPSILKLCTTDLLAAMSIVAGQIVGPRLVADTGEWGTACWSRHALESAGLRIGGGTDEIQRNILGERSRGLPREPRPTSDSSAAPVGG